MDAESFCFADGPMQLLWRPSDACMHFQWLCRSFKVRVREKDRLIEAAVVPLASRVLQVLNHPSHLEIAPGAPPSGAEELPGRSENYPQGTTSFLLSLLTHTQRGPYQERVDSKNSLRDLSKQRYFKIFKSIGWVERWFGNSERSREFPNLIMDPWWYFFLW